MNTEDSLEDILYGMAGKRRINPVPHAKQAIQAYIDKIVVEELEAVRSLMLKRNEGLLSMDNGLRSRQLDTMLAIPSDRIATLKVEPRGDHE